MSQVTPQDGLGKAGQDQQDTLRPVSMDELFARAENDYVESKKEEGLRNAGLSSDRGSTRDTIGGQSSLASLYTAKRRTKYTRRPENDSQPSFEDEIQMIRDEMPEATLLETIQYLATHYYDAHQALGSSEEPSMKRSKADMLRVCEGNALVAIGVVLEELIKYETGLAHAELNHTQSGPSSSAGAISPSDGTSPDGRHSCSDTDETLEPH